MLCAKMCAQEPIRGPARAHQELPVAVHCPPEKNNKGLYTNSFSHFFGVVPRFSPPNFAKKKKAITSNYSLFVLSANLFCIWKFHLAKATSRQWGTLSTSPDGYPMWRHSSGRIMALAQFRDKIVVVAAGQGASSAMQDVCDTLTEIWNLRVLCPCMKEPDDQCTSLCMSQDLHALGICMHCANGKGSCVAHPSAFNAEGQLKLGPRLQSAWTVEGSMLANLYTRVLVNALPFVSS